MPSATLNLRVTPRRMLSEREAADYCAMTAKRFRAACPVTAVAFPDGVTAYDMRDLDNWIDTLKAGGRGHDDAVAILERLG